MSAYFTLFRIRIALMASLSAAMGFLLAADGADVKNAIGLCGVLLLSCGASVLNQIQERDLDARMERTKSRPIPAGLISLPRAWGAVFLLVVSGLTLLVIPSFTAAGLGVLALLWYNGMYTSLKKSTPFAVIPGAVVGAVPPMIGWVLAGGSLLDREIGSIAFFFFIWQVPHFWLFLLENGGDYEKAGLPSLTSTFSARQLRRITFVWVVSTAVACLTLPMFGAAGSPLVRIALFSAGVRLVWIASRMLRDDCSRPVSTLSFKEINLYALFVISLLSLDKLL
jgi:protoheme IX farnesyltransferase